MWVVRLVMVLCLLGMMILMVGVVGRLLEDVDLLSLALCVHRVVLFFLLGVVPPPNFDNRLLSFPFFC